MGEVRDLSSARGRADEHKLTLHATPAATRIVRHWVMRVVAAAGIGGSLNQLVEVLTAELVAEAVRIGTPAAEVDVRVRIDGECVRVTITGPGPATPTPTGPTCLALVEVLANAWGTTSVREGERTVWFDVATAGR